jgi:hypothetical protein
MPRRARIPAVHRRKPASKEPGPLCWGLTLIFVSGINIAAFNLSVATVDHTEYTDKSLQPETISWNSSNSSDTYQRAESTGGRRPTKYERLPLKLPPDSDATTHEQGVLWNYRLPDGVEFSLMQMPTSQAVEAGHRYTAAHRYSSASGIQVKN